MIALKIFGVSLFPVLINYKYIFPGDRGHREEEREFSKKELNWKNFINENGWIFQVVFLMLVSHF